MKQKTYKFKAKGVIQIPYEDVLTVLAKNEREGVKTVQEGFNEIIKERFGPGAEWYSLYLERSK